MAETAFDESPAELSRIDKWIKYGMIVILSVFWFFFNGRLGTIQADKVTFFVVFITLAAFAGLGAYDSIKNATAKYVFNDGWCTTDGEYAQVGNFAVLTPAIKAWNMYWHLKSPVFVAPIDGMRHKGRNLVANVRMELVTLEEMPPQIQDFILENGLKPPYYLGLADVEQYEQILKDPEKVSGIETPSVSYLIQQSKEMNKQNAMQRRMLAEAYGVSEETIAAKMRIIERMKPSELEKSLKKIFVSEESPAG